MRQVNKSVASLDLQWNDIGREGGEALAAALKVDPNPSINSVPVNLYANSKMHVVWCNCGVVC
jgi:hypothetical protein